jgi:hypothetical protein
MTGIPRASSKITHLPDAPKVDFTALASLSTPAIIFDLALSPNSNDLMSSLG